MHSNWVRGARHLAWAIAALSLVVLVSAPLAAASKNQRSAGPLHGRVPAKQAAIFRALKRPALKQVPRRIVRLVATRAFKQIGADAHQIRRVGSPSSKPLYLVPGVNGLCLVLDNTASLCTEDIERVRTNGLSVDIVNAVTQPDGTVDPFGSVVTYGVAPDGFTAVTVTTDNGGTATGNITNNAYSVSVTAPINSRTLTGPGRDPVTTPPAA